MKPLIVLLLVFSISAILIKLITGKIDFLFSARIAMCAMLIFTSIGHFVYTKGMTMMIPSFIPYKIEIVYFTAILEVLLGIGLFFPSLRIYCAWALIIFFILILPANVNAAVKHIDYQRGTFDGGGSAYLWFRVPLQILFIVWTYLSNIKSGL